MWEFLLPLLVSMLSGGIGSALQAGTTESANKRTALGEQSQRRSLQSVVEELRNPDYSGVDAQFMLDLGRTLGQLKGKQAASGTTGSGRGQSAIDDAVTKGLAQLAQFKTTDQTNRAHELASIFANPAFAGANPSSFDPGGAAAKAFFGGLLAGGGSALTSFLGTQGGAEILKNALGGGESFAPIPKEGPVSGSGIAPKIDWGSYFSTPTFNNPSFDLGG